MLGRTHIESCTFLLQVVHYSIRPMSFSSPAGTPTEALWEKLEEAKIDDYSEFNELFSRQIITRKPTKKKAEEPSRQQAAKVLDSKRSQNVGILSSSLHVDFSEIENAIYNFDTSVVNLEALQQIYEMVGISSHFNIITGSQIVIQSWKELKNFNKCITSRNLKGRMFVDEQHALYSSDHPVILCMRSKKITSNCDTIFNITK